MILAGSTAGMDRRNRRGPGRVFDMTRRGLQLGRNTLIEGLVPPDGGSVLEIGCGTAHNLVRAARRYPGAQLYGIDTSHALIKTAARRVAAAGLAGRVRLAQDDAAGFDPAALFGLREFERVFISYALAFLPGWHGVLDRAALALSSAGSLHLVDFGRGEDLPRPARALLEASLDRFSAMPRPDLEIAARTTAARHGLEVFFTPLYRGLAAYAVLSGR